MTTTKLDPRIPKQLQLELEETRKQFKNKGYASDQDIRDYELAINNILKTAHGYKKEFNKEYRSSNRSRLNFDFPTRKKEVIE